MQEPARAFVRDPSLFSKSAAAQACWAAAQPEFRPYATMDKSDVDDCRDKGVVNL